MAVKKQHWGWMRHVLTVLSICIFFLGCFIIGYMSWVLATSALTVNRFLSGTQVFTYAVIGHGFFLFVYGLIGTVGSYTRSKWLVQLFVGASTICILAEIGGIITLNVAQIQMGDVVEHGWSELNQATRNLVQTSMECCGFSGPQEFAFSSSPIESSCYEPSDSEENVSFMEEDVVETINPHYRIKQNGCGPKLYQWFEKNKVGWVSVIATIGATEFMAAAVAVFILFRLQSNVRPRTLSRRRLRQHEAETSNDVLPSELP